MQRALALLFLTAGLAAVLAAIVGFQTLGGQQHPLVPLVATAIVQTILVVLAFGRGVPRLVLVSVGVLEIVVGLGWSAFIPRGSACCPPPPPALPLGGNWALVIALCGAATVFAALVAPDRSRGDAGAVR